MLKRLKESVSSSIGKKVLVALTGLALVGYLVLHLAGNLLLYSGSDMRAFDEYAEGITKNPLLPFAEIALLALFVVHIVLAMRVTMENRDARSDRYVVRASRGARTLASSTMIASGIVVMLFLIVHVWDFRVPKLLGTGDPSLGNAVKTRLATPVAAIVYLVGVAALGLHLRHAVRSALQTLGVGRRDLEPMLNRLSWIVAIVLALGFASFPLYFLAKA